LREGEKLYEELITQDEGVASTKYEKIMVLHSNGRNGKKNRDGFSRWLNESLEDLYQIVGTHDAHAIRTKLKEILPEYLPEQNGKCVLGMSTPAHEATANLRVRLAT
jgi:FlaA1/EpsC-like NDP-sugar epimerase